MATGVFVGRTVEQFYRCAKLLKGNYAEMEHSQDSGCSIPEEFSFYFIW